VAWEAPLTKVTVRFIEKYLPDVVRWTFTPPDDLPERFETPVRERKPSTPQAIPARYEAAVVALEQVLLLKRYSHRTVKTYLSALSHQNQILSAIKMFYSEVVCQEEKVWNLIRPKRAMKLPRVLTEQEVERLLKATDNLKHRCILMLIYSAGLRLGELIRLRLADLEPEQGRLFVYGGKGKKDRSKITELYTHITRIGQGRVQSPLDRLNL
jgi:integrase